MKARIREKASLRHIDKGWPKIPRFNKFTITDYSSIVKSPCITFLLKLNLSAFVLPS